MTRLSLAFCVVALFPVAGRSLGKASFKCSDEAGSMPISHVVGNFFHAQVAVLEKMRCLSEVFVRLTHSPMQTPVWCLNNRWRYEGLRWNSRARSRMVNVVPESAIRRIFCTRGSSTVGADGRDRATAAGRHASVGNCDVCSIRSYKAVTRIQRAHRYPPVGIIIGLNASEGELLRKSPSAGGSDLIILVRKASVAVVEA